MFGESDSVIIACWFSGCLYKIQVVRLVSKLSALDAVDFKTHPRAVSSSRSSHCFKWGELERSASTSTSSSSGSFLLWVFLLLLHSRERPSTASQFHFSRLPYPPLYALSPVSLPLSPALTVPTVDWVLETLFFSPTPSLTVLLQQSFLSRRRRMRYFRWTNSMHMTLVIISISSNDYICEGSCLHLSPRNWKGAFYAVKMSGRWWLIL